MEDLWKIMAYIGDEYPTCSLRHGEYNPSTHGVYMRKAQVIANLGHPHTVGPAGLEPATNGL